MNVEQTLPIVAPNNSSESLSGSSPNLEFQYFENRLFNVTAFILLISYNFTNLRIFIFNSR